MYSRRAAAQSVQSESVPPVDQSDVNETREQPSNQTTLTNDNPGKMNPSKHPPVTEPGINISLPHTASFGDSEINDNSIQNQHIEVA